MLVKKREKKAYIIFSIITVLIIAGYVFYKIKKHDVLYHQLKEIVKDKTHQLYSINYDSISVNEVGGDLFIKNIYIKGDTARQLEMINSKDTNATAAIFDIYVPVLKVVNFKTARALLSKQLECKQILISNPQVQVYLFPGEQIPKDSRKQQEELYKQILGKFKLIKADTVSILNASVTASNFYTKEAKFRTFNTSVNLSQVAIDSTYNQDTSRTLFCKEIALTSEKVILGDKKNTAEITQATFDTRSKRLAFTSLAYDAFKNNGFFKTKLEGISIEGIEWTGPVENSDLIIDKAIISKGELETLTNENKENKNKPKKEGRILTGWIKKFSLNDLEVKSVNYISKMTGSKEKPLIVKNNRFSIRHISIDRMAAFNSKLISQAKEIELNNDEIIVKSGDNLYEYRVAGIKLNTRTRSLSFESIRVIPQLDEAAFAKKAHFQTDRFDINIKNIRCSNLDPEKLIRGEVEIGTIRSTGSTIKDFRDLAYPIDSTSRQGQQMTYPQQLLRLPGVPIKVNSAFFNNTYIEYKEKNSISKNSGRVRFSNTSLSFNNISTEKPKKGEKMVANFTSTFLDKVPITGRFTFSLDQWEKGVFTVEASVANAVDATILNQLTEPMSLMKVEKGEIKSVRFYMRADTNTSHGTLIMPYRNLKISLLKKDQDEYNKKTMLSLLVNIAVRNNNKEGNNMRIGKAVLTRNKYRSFFNFIWTTIFTSIKDIGVLKI